MEDPSEKICVIGQGYVGLTLTAVVAQSGYEVLGIEKDESKLELLKEGRTHFDEPGLEAAVKTQMRLGNLSFAKSVSSDAARECGTYILAVGSPLDGEEGPDLSILRSAVDSVTDVLSEGDTVVIRTTISVGTAREMGDLIETKTDFEVGEDVYLAQAPERTVQGAALEEIQSLPQIIGGYNKASTDQAEVIFNDISESLIKVESLEAAELVKLFDNTYRDISIAIGNAFGEVAAAHGLDGQRLIDIANAGYGRNQIKKPGAGVGGGCLPKDPYLLVDSMSEGSDVVELARELVLTARDINESMPEVTCSLIEDALRETGRSNREVTALVAGVAFKGRPATNDTRNTPAKPIVDALNERGTVHAYDPHVDAEDVSELGAHPVEAESLADALQGETYDLLVVANNNPGFKNLDLSFAADRMSDDPILVDGWGTFDARTASQIGFNYRLVGGDRRRE